MAYAAVVSLLQILKQIDHPNSDQFSQSQMIESLRNKVLSLKSHLQKNSVFLVSHLDILVIGAIRKAEETSIVKLGYKFGENNERNRLDFRPRQCNVMLGRDEEFTNLTEWLIRPAASRLEVVPIVGPFGIGKTTMAKAVYNSPLILNRFKTRAWVTIPPKYTTREILIDLLRSMRKLSDEMHEKTDKQLAKYLHNCLKFRKYLLVLDDVWDVEHWNDLIELFPNHNNGNDDKAWNLLHEIVFVNESPPPPELEKIAMEIALKCRGLPLALVTIAKLLCWTSIIDWKTILCSIDGLMEEMELVLTIMMLAYNRLPQNLKACLLYMAVFPFKYEIPAPKLTKLLIAEEFLELEGFETLEERTEECLWQLVDKSLVSVCQQSSRDHVYPLREWFELKLLRVLDVLNIRFYSFPLELLEAVHSRYLAFSCNGELPASACKLLYLRVLIIHRYLNIKRSGALQYLPMEVWNMKELRYVQIMGSDLPDPSTTATGNDGSDLLLENLLSLLDVSPHSCTRGVLQRIPNLKKLAIRIESMSAEEASDEAFSFLSNLVVLQRLESLKCIFLHPCRRSQVVSSISALPPSLIKLTLSGCGLSWEDMAMIVALPNLEVLKLQRYAFRGPKWLLNNEVFTRLKFLLVEDTDIEHWMADDTSFPRTSVVISAEQIEEKQRSLGNYGIKVQIYSSLDDENMES
ncbi:hypothetical protein BUALT_Bualt17G0062000 [Buddleja alternifolia]|uniref:NB-ARC domain-containing protein n=1 Tax=Buddleja alternifolia TaxID=168488 RepID=A0AAV6WH36_9LAMI|nr:hypothetical protein BUALT_Bualt17G0062000 [Buddleja alternifolia]